MSLKIVLFDSNNSSVDDFASVKCMAFCFACQIFPVH